MSQKQSISDGVIRAKVEPSGALDFDARISLSAKGATNAISGRRILIIIYSDRTRSFSLCHFGDSGLNDAAK